MRKLTVHSNITGRDDYVLMQALAHATVALENLPEEWQEDALLYDMRHLLAHFTVYPRVTQIFFDGARLRFALGRLPRPQA